MPAAREEVTEVRAEQQVDAAGQRQIALALPQALAGEVDGHQRRRAGGVHGHARPAEVEDVGEPVGGDAEGAAGTQVGIGRRLLLEMQTDVVGGADAHENADGLPLQPWRGQSRVLQGFAGDLQQQALLRVRAGGLARRDPEESRIEAVHPFHQRRPAGALRLRRFGGEPSAAALRRDLHDGAPAGAQQVPERRRVGRPGKPAGHADDGDGLLRASRRLRSPPPGCRPGIQKLRQGRQSGEVIEDRRRKVPSQPAPHLPGDLDGGDGGQAEAAQRLKGRERTGRHLEVPRHDLGQPFGDRTSGV